MNVKQLINIANTFKRGAAAQQDAAAALRKVFRSRSMAGAAMLPVIAKAYGAKISTTKTGTTRWVKNDKAAAAAKRALNRLLAIAYPCKAITKRAKADPVALLLRKFGKLSAAQQRRFLKSAK